MPAQRFLRVLPWSICVALNGVTPVRAVAADAVAPAEVVRVAPSDPALCYSGRREVLESGEVALGYSGARIRLRFTGPAITLRMADARGENYAQAWIDGAARPKFRLGAGAGVYPLASDLGEGEHTVEVVRLTECFLGLTRFQGFDLAGGARVLPWPAEPERRIEFIGDSITCGYGVETDNPADDFTPGTENFALTYTGLTIRNLGADYVVVARSGIGMLRNYGGPRDGSADAIPITYRNTFYHDSRWAWDAKRFDPDVICINLGTNDFSGGGVEPEKFEQTYVDFAGGLLAAHPKARLVVLQGPMNNNDNLGAVLRRVVERLEETAPGRVRYFELSHEGALGLGAHHHPNRAQSRKNAEELTAFLSELTGWEAADGR